jgi:glucose/arabinose dehydrogenase
LLNDSMQKGAFALGLLAASTLASADVDYATEIQPIFAENCYLCHGEFDPIREGDFRLDVKASAFGEIADGRHPIVPGDAANSEVYRRISAPTAEQRMPPYATGRRLSSEQVELIRQWIDEGADWPDSAAAPAPMTGLLPVDLPDEPFIERSHAVPQFRVVPMVKGLSHPWSLAFLPNGDMLVTERKGTLRLIRDGKLLPEPVSGLPADIKASGLMGLMEVALHPDFERNRYVYLTYTRNLPDNAGAVALVRGRLEGTAMRGVEDLLVVAPWASEEQSDELQLMLGVFSAGARIAFGPDGKLFVAIGGAMGVERPDGSISFAGVAHLAQDPGSLVGKIVRLNDDGSVPEDNPFVGQLGYRPEIYSMGHRNPQGLTVHPWTGELYESEHGAQGGDELNIITAGGNYGWPLVSMGREYAGPRISARFWEEGMLEPAVYWVPSIAPSGLAFYTGDAFPAWKGNLFTGAMLVGRIPMTGHLQRIEFNDQGEEVARESLLTDRHQRIRDVRQGPDGLLYLLTEEVNGALLRLEPVD